MFQNKLLFLICALTALMLTSCSDEPNSVGADLLGQDIIEIKELDSNIDSLEQQSSFGLRPLPLGGGARLLLGKTSDMEASTLIRFRFISLPDSLRNAVKNGNLTILSSKVELTQNYSFRKSGSFDFTVHKINSRWSTQGFNKDSLSVLMYDPADLAANKNITDSLLTFDIDKQLVTNWLLAEADTVEPVDNGIYILPVSTAGILGFQSVTTVNADVPILRVQAVTSASSDTVSLNFIPAADVSVVNAALPSLENRFVVHSGFITNSKLRFDINKIPSSSIVNRASISISLDTTLTKTGSKYSGVIYVAFLKDSSSFSLDSSRVVSLTRSGNKFSGDITTFVQRWVNGEQNQGILLWNSDQTDGVERFVFYGSGYADRTLQPNLKIYYTSKNTL